MQVVLLSGEAVHIASALAQAETQMGSIALVALFLVFSLFGMLLNWSMFLCTMSNSALTTTIVGVLKVGSCGQLNDVIGFRVCSTNTFCIQTTDACRSLRLACNVWQLMRTLLSSIMPMLIAGSCGHSVGILPARRSGVPHLKCAGNLHQYAGWYMVKPDSWISNTLTKH